MSAEWQALKKGDTVRIIAPGAKSPNFWEELEKCCEFLRSLDLNPLYSQNISPVFEDGAPSFYNFSNVDEVRYEDFVDALHSDADAVWCFRGGYGSDRILSQAVRHNMLAPEVAKLFIGFSDITNLHNYMNTHWQWSTLHGPSLKQVALNALDAADVDTTINIIFGKINEVTLHLVPLNAAAKQPAKIQGQMAGGNLITIQSAIGTPWQMPVEDKIILFEDVDEAPYRIARVFQHFLASGQLQNARAVILGDFTEQGKTSELMLKVLQEFADYCTLPVLRYEGIGHGTRNHPIPFGTETHLTLGEEPLLKVATGLKSKSNG
jgi:muramoyltetrapeptide carboxypeptidase